MLLVRLSSAVLPLRGFRLVTLITLIAIGWSTTASAAVVAYVTAPGATTGGQPVSAKVTFTTSANTVTIVLENLLANPTSVTQCLSGLQFHIGSGETSGTLASSSGTNRFVSPGGSYVDGSSVPTGWSLSTVSTDLKLNLLGTPIAPEHTIIGPSDGVNLYSAGNNSITGNPHNPFLGLTATFTLNVPGVTAASQITSAVFQFNTAPGNTVPGVPEPASLATLGLGATALIRRRPRR